MRAVTKKIVSRVLTVFLVLASLFSMYLFGHYLFVRNWLGKLKNSPMTLAVDLSTPGTYSAPYRQFAPAPSAVIQLFLDIPSRAEPIDNHLLTGLAFDVKIQDTIGAEVYSNGFRSDNSANGAIWRFRDDFRLEGVTFPRGDYEFNLTVLHPAYGLAGIPHTVRAGYPISIMPYALTATGTSASGTAFVAFVLLIMRRVVSCASVDAEGRCVECGYDLQGNTSGRCPECGVPVDLDRARD